jgi:MFS family permease
MQDFHMSQEIGTLTISLFVAGYCVGPLLWGPLSEQVNGLFFFYTKLDWPDAHLNFIQYGRRPVFIVTFFMYTVSWFEDAIILLLIISIAGLSSGVCFGPELGSNSNFSLSGWDFCGCASHQLWVKEMLKSHNALSDNLIEP